MEASTEMEASPCVREGMKTTETRVSPYTEGKMKITGRMKQLPQVVVVIIVQYVGNDTIPTFLGDNMKGKHFLSQRYMVDSHLGGHLSPRRGMIDSNLFASNAYCPFSYPGISESRYVCEFLEHNSCISLEFLQSHWNSHYVEICLNPHTPLEFFKSLDTLVLVYWPSLTVNPNIPDEFILQHKEIYLSQLETGSHLSYSTCSSRPISRFRIPIEIIHEIKEDIRSYCDNPYISSEWLRRVHLSYTDIERLSKNPHAPIEFFPLFTSDALEFNKNPGEIMKRFSTELTTRALHRNIHLPLDELTSRLTTRSIMKAICKNVNVSEDILRGRENWICWGGLCVPILMLQ